MVVQIGDGYCWGVARVDGVARDARSRSPVCEEAREGFEPERPRFAPRSEGDGLDMKEEAMPRCACWMFASLCRAQAWAVMERQEGNLDKAGKLVKQALEINPRHGALWTVCGQVEFLRGFHLRARKVRAGVFVAIYPLRPRRDRSIGLEPCCERCRSRGPRCLTGRACRDSRPANPSPLRTGEVPKDPSAMEHDCCRKRPSSCGGCTNRASRRYACHLTGCREPR